MLWGLEHIFSDVQVALLNVGESNREKLEERWGEMNEAISRSY